MDKVAKIRPVIDQFNKICKLIDSDQHCSVDENTIPYKGKKSKLRQYNPKKTLKNGVVNSLCSAAANSGLSLLPNYMKAKQKKISCASQLPTSSQVVERLSLILPDGKNFKMAFDNWFSSVQLFEKLAARGILAISTFQNRRFKGLNFPSDLEMKKEGRGTFFEKQLSNDNCTITAVKWYDNKPVFLASSYKSCSNTINVKRWNFATQKEIDVLAPALVPEYNSFMGQVDNIGRLLAAFRIKLAVKKRFYMRIFFSFL